MLVSRTSVVLGPQTRGGGGDREGLVECGGISRQGNGWRYADVTCCNLVSAATASVVLHGMSLFKGAFTGYILWDTPVQNLVILVHPC